MNQIIRATGSACACHHRSLLCQRWMSSSTPSDYPTALATVGHLLRNINRSSQFITRSSSGLQSSMLWILRTCSTQDLVEIMNGTVARRIDRIPPFNRTPNPHPLLLQVFRFLKSDNAIYNRTLHLLTKDRLHELDLPSKCALVKALQMSSGQKFAGTLDNYENEVVTNVLMSVQGDDLTTMKNMLNDVGNRFSLHQLMFHAVIEPWRSTVLHHFQEQQTNQVDLHRTKKPIKVLSDIDDTLFSSWLDKRWPRELVYPGVRQFFVELTHRNNNNSKAQVIHRIGSDFKNIHTNIHINTLERMIAKVNQLLAERQIQEVDDFSETETKQDLKEEHAIDRFRLFREKSLSAWINHEEDEESDIDFDDFHPINTSITSTTSSSSLSSSSSSSSSDDDDDRIAPEISTDEPTTLEDVTYITARPHGYRGVVAALTRRRLRLAGMSERPNVMLGDFGGLLGNKRIALKKFTNFAEFSLLFPEYDFILVGDSGQGDAALGGLMREHYPNKLCGVFIHNISKKEVTGDGRLKSEYIDDMNFHFFQTYIGSATQAYQDDLIDEDGILRVALAALEEFLAMSFPLTSKGQDLYKNRLTDVRNDLISARDAVQRSYDDDN